MAHIISLETSTTICSVALHKEGLLVASQIYSLEKSHSTLLPGIIHELLNNTEMMMSDIDAFAISSGPGSYTGLRIGVSTIQGLAYALNKPVISINTLDVLIAAVTMVIGRDKYLCPMIDARRQEVYCKLIYENEEVWATQAKIIDESSFQQFDGERIICFGNGAEKFGELFANTNVDIIGGIIPNAMNMGELAFSKFKTNEFVDVAYIQPEYAKEFHSIPSKKKLI